MTTTYNDFNIKPGMSTWASLPAEYQAEYFTFLADIAAAAAAQTAAELDEVDERWEARIYEQQAAALLT
jgi:hypothetical protein